MYSNKFKLKNYEHKYSDIMHFNKNKDTYIHRWYPFVEGYSKEFILSIINELDYIPKTCLDPFAGSGTTPLELQKLKIKCYSFEVSPFMYDLSTAKMCIDYDINVFNHYLELISYSLKNYISNIYDYISIPNFKTIVEKNELKSWNFDREVMYGILDIKYAISLIEDPIYEKLFNIALASILLNVSNLYRNGKCLSYKKNWKSTNLTRVDVHNIYLKKVKNIFLPDILKISKYKEKDKLFSNLPFCFLGDVRKKINKLDNSSIDLIITSPPYLNSRDYTDTYMIELRMLNYLNTYEAIRTLRNKTIRSHVQVKWKHVDTLEIKSLKDSISRIENYHENFWNDSLLNMIKGYFDDMNILFKNLYLKVRKGGRIYFNVANSSYFGIEIKTDEIIAEIAEKSGFRVLEIRQARKIKPSSQQKDKIPFLRESVIVIVK